MHGIINSSKTCRASPLLCMLHTPHHATPAMPDPLIPEKSFRLPAALLSRLVLASSPGGDPEDLNDLYGALAAANAASSSDPVSEQQPVSEPRRGGRTNSSHRRHVVSPDKAQLMLLANAADAGDHVLFFPHCSWQLWRTLEVGSCGSKRKRAGTCTRGNFLARDSLLSMQTCEGKACEGSVRDRNLSRHARPLEVLSCLNSHPSPFDEGIKELTGNPWTSSVPNCSAALFILNSQTATRPKANI